MTKLQDPRTQYPQPPFREGQPKPPATEDDLSYAADHGEESYTGSGLLKGLNALITGADSGIGRAVAIAFAREGANVAISYLKEHDDAKETKKWVEKAGTKALLLPGDITSEDHCKLLVDRVQTELGSLDILVNNAAFQMSYKKLDEIPTDEFDRAFRTNLYAPFWLSRAAAKIIKPGGSIINTASINSYQPNPILLPYATTKAAIAGFTKALAHLLIKQGIRVNAVAPGPVYTPLIPSTLPKDMVKNFGGDTPMGRPAQPAELAPAFVFLASPQCSSYVTGMVYGVTGGDLTA